MLRSALVFVSSIVLVLAGCSRHRDGTTAGAASATSPIEEQQSSSGHDPCSLLEPKEVEAVLGAPLATPPFLASQGHPSSSGEGCGYRDAGFHTISVEVTWDGAPQIWKMYGSLQAAANQNAKGMLHLADGSDISGEWDEARVLNCCKFMALLGDQMVSVDVGETPAVSIAQAAQLADAALKRLKKPLSIDGNAGVQSARAFDTSHRPRHVDPCSLLTRGEAEAVLGPLTADPISNKDTCTYPRSPDGRIRTDVELKVMWSGGYSDLRQKTALGRSLAQGFVGANSYLSPQAAKGVQSILAGAAPKSSDAWELSGPTVAGGVSAVKNDVQVSLDGNSLKRVQAEQLLSQAMPRIQTAP
jgi:hypothetical protein